MRVLTAGAGAGAALSGPGRGQVLASFAKACYLELPGGLVALVGPEVLPGPLHAILDAPPPRPPAGTAVCVAGGTVQIGEIVVVVRTAVPWRGALPDPSRMAGCWPELDRVLAPVAARSLVPPAAAGPAREHLGAGDLAGAARCLAGAGPGLTPAGDDALAGILFARRALGHPEPELCAVAAAAETTTLAAALLDWAARGQALSCVHDLLLAATGGDRAAAEVAGQRLASVGHSSGADLALGLRWGLAPGSLGHRVGGGEGWIMRN